MDKNNKLLTLGIESSCDETAAAVTAGGREVLSNIVASQIDVHRVFGGVVPEIAARHHLTEINFVIDEALAAAGVTMDEIDLIGVTEGPGLVGSVLIGLATANALAYAARKPLVGVHHIKGHIFAAFLEHPDLEPPFLALVISGGHTDLIDVTAEPAPAAYQNAAAPAPGLVSPQQDAAPGAVSPAPAAYQDAPPLTFRLLGSTRDDAVGEAFDKVARVLGLGYPGGPKIDALAKEGDGSAVAFKRVLLEKDSLDFSFSGIKTGVINYLNTEKQAGRPVSAANVAASFETSVTDVIVTKTLQALRETGRDKLVAGGGVAANSYLRARLAEAAAAEGVGLFIPSLKYCGDNAAMIACAAYYEYISGKTSELGLDAKSRLEL
ncbi:MAG: tRNA (adenosine(37)-N6)-threonylcarbamoyltransferase complex transferase subunit TsaD [Clostridiales Family XIII bacterium]|jgi:N6-L-threonylcarbamoyladenine synthase|nr:tRNA (adenosine(37)-N6)-threonylcarbamoyltransferase complex transferase subunit TsaD [Clostridiales Family XIII bacterium]